MSSLSGFLSWVSGAGVSGETYVVARWLFLRAMGVIYLIAFLSLWVQIKGLIGSQGILPAKDFLSAVGSHFGVDRFRLVPTVLWITSSDIALHVVCALGALCSLLVIFGVAPTVNFAILWLLYLSLTVVGQDFMSFQWDILLLEAGFLCIFFSPLGVLPRFQTAVSPLVLFLLWWLLFRLMFESGVVKLTSGDPHWWNLTAMRYHYFTQPLPTWTAWYMHQLPDWFGRLSVLFMFGVELVLPFLIVVNPALRLVACAGLVLLQLLIMATGNYNFFNLLSIALCFPLIPDAYWGKVFPQSFLAWIGAGATAPPLAPWYSVLIVIVAVPIVLIGANQMVETLFERVSIPGLDSLELALQPFRTVNSYGLFRVMTTERPEVAVEGSDDGKTWKEYLFRWKPGDVNEAPPFVEPHQPRLEWQMWFAALGNFQTEPWFQQFLLRLLQGSPDVLALLRTNPFPVHPPRYVRSLLYRYEFTRLGEKGWWKRELLGQYAPVMSLAH